MDQLAVEPLDHAVSSPAQLPCIGCNRFENRLHVALRLADHAQNLARGSLLLQCFSQVVVAGLQFLEQTHILNSNDRLRSKRLEQGNMRLRERARLSATDID